MTPEERLTLAMELLRGAHQLLQKQDRSPIVLNLLGEEQTANGGGDGYCLMEEIGTFFSDCDVSLEPEFPAESAEG